MLTFINLDHTLSRRRIRIRMRRIRMRRRRRRRHIRKHSYPPVLFVFYRME